MARYVKKPIEIEAFQTDKELIIHTLEGDMKANVGDYIITGVEGEQYPCKPNIFEKTYEIATNNTADVVPRSEVEKLTEERDKYKKYYFRHEYDKWEAEIKQEVAREIFDLIKLYKQKWASGEVVPYRFIAELEKEYIGKDTDVPTKTGETK